MNKRMMVLRSNIRMKSVEENLLLRIYLYIILLLRRNYMRNIYVIAIIVRGGLPLIG